MPDVPRRQFLKGLGGAIAAALAGCVTGDGGPNVFIGPVAARPDANGAFFVGKNQYTYVYVAEDDGSVWAITEQTNDWVQAL